MYKERIGKNTSYRTRIGNIVKDRNGNEWVVVKVFKKIKKKKENKPKIGQYVNIIIKPYNKKIIKSGIIKKILTKKKYHSRGHKVILSNGLIGRIYK